MARRKPATESQKTEKHDKHSRQKESHRSIRPDVIIACEDISSSPEYFRQMMHQLKAAHQVTPDSLVIARHTKTHPTGVLADLTAHKTTQGKSYQKFTHKWIVIDRDVEIGQGNGHTEKDFNDALIASRSADVKVAYANDCFELWYLLHFEMVTGEIVRTDLIPRVIWHLKVVNAQLFAKLDEDSIKSSIMTKEIFNILLPKQDKAIERAKCLLASYAPNNPAKDNPSTTVHELVCLLRTLHVASPKCVDIVPCDGVIACS